MALRTQHEFLFIGRDEGSFVENYAYDLGESAEHSGRIFLNLEIQNNPAEAEMIAETIFDTVRKAFFADLEKDAYARFEDALKDVNQALNAMREEKASQYIGNLHVLIGAIVDNNLYLTQCGDAEAYLIRKRFCSIVSEGLTDPQSKDFFSNIASGVLEPGDFVLLSSTRLLRYIAKTDLGKIASSHHLVSILGELKDFLATEVLNRIGCIGIVVLQNEVGFSPEEQGKVLAHLEKDEEYERGGIQEHKSTTVTVSDVGRKVSDLMSSAKERFRSYQQSSPRSREARRRGGDFASGAWSKEKIIISLVVLVVVLGGGIWWLSARSAEESKNNAYAATLAKAQDEISSAESAAQYNPQTAAQYLDRAENEVRQVYNAGYSRNKAGLLLESIQTMRDKIDVVTHVQPKVFADLSQKRANVSAIGLLNLKDTLYAFEYNALYPILLDKIQDPVTIDDNEEVQMGTTAEDQGSLLFFTKNAKVIEYKDNHTSFLTTSEGSFHKGVAIKAYGSKVYILDPDGNQIWKYVRSRDKFSSSQAYSDADVKKAIDFTIDGSIYVLNSDGSLLRFFSGKKVDLTIKKGPLKPLTQPKKIFTTTDLKKLFILEPSQHRVLVYTKDDNGNLTYLSQYVFDTLNGVRDFYVDKDGKNVYLVDASKVYSFAL